MTNIYKNLCNIHFSKQKIKKKKLNIYKNYHQKIQDRINQKDDIIKKFGSENFKKLTHYLIKYEKYDLGNIGVIHGDPVLSNIIKKTNDDLVFLDPRGSLGNEFTIYGDTNYDFSKVYQSLNGYENIILDKKIDYDYLKDLKNHFESLLMTNKKIDNINTIKFLTSSLYFTLIKFHNKKYTNKFLDISRNLIK